MAFQMSVLHLVSVIATTSRGTNHLVQLHSLLYYVLTILDLVRL